MKKSRYERKIFFEKKKVTIERIEKIQMKELRKSYESKNGKIRTKEFVENISRMKEKKSYE